MVAPSTTSRASARPVPVTVPEENLAAERTGCGPCGEPPLTLEDAGRYAGVLKALADPQRLRLLSLLAAQATDEPLCVCEIEEGFELSQGTISHHLKVLREAGLVTVTKRGLWHYYSVAPAGLAPVRDVLALLHPAVD